MSIAAKCIFHSLIQEIDTNGTSSTKYFFRFDNSKKTNENKNIAISLLLQRNTYI